jgi:WD40 repeat protein
MDDRGRFSLRKLGQWETSENDQGASRAIRSHKRILIDAIGLIALSTMPGSTLLALPGRQAGHVQLIQLPPCPSPKSASSPGPSNPKSQGFRSPIILAHTHPLSTLTCTPSGSHIITTSERGTLLRVWDTARGQLQRELRRGVDRAEMWGARFEPPDSETLGGKGGRVVGWSDKGTMHIWDDETNPLRDGSA